MQVFRCARLRNARRTILRISFVAVAFFATCLLSPADAQTVLPDYSAATFSNPLQIDNPYHPLRPGQVREYALVETDPDTGEVDTERIVVQTLPDVRVVDGVQARVVRDRVYNANDQIIEDTFDWFAQDDAGNVWYFGESVTDYHYDDDGNFLNTTNPGQWETGVDGALPGFIMPAVHNVGDKFYSEFYEGEAEDEFEVLAVGLTHTIPATAQFTGVFDEVLKTFDTTALDAESLEHKYYAPGIGKIGSESLVDGVSIGGESLVNFVVPEPDGDWLVLAAAMTLAPLARRRRRIAWR